MTWSSITNSVVHGSIGWSFSAQYSANVNLESNSFIGARAVAVNVFGSNNITISNNIAGDVRRREELVMQDTVDIEAVYSICAYFGSDSNCYDNPVIGNVAAGGMYAGFVAPGDDCDGAYSSSKFRDNVAHSIERSGAYIFPDVRGNDHARCYKGTHFAAYKCGETGVGAHFASQEIRMTDITSIDNVLGINVQTAGDHDNIIAVLEDSFIYGETEAEDCPDNHPCGCFAKEGIMLFSNNHKGKAFHIAAPSALPMHKSKSYGTWAGEALYRNNKFINFNVNKTACGAPQRIFKINKSDSDYIPIQNFEYTEFVDVHDDALAYLMDPPESWNNLSDCIAFPCTAPSNVVMNFERTTFNGRTRP